MFDDGKMYHRILMIACTENVAFEFKYKRQTLSAWGNTDILTVSVYKLAAVGEQPLKE